MKTQHAAAAAISVALLSSPAWSLTVTQGVTFQGGLNTIWSSDLGLRLYQGIHPDQGSPGGPPTPQSGTTTPATVSPDYLFAAQQVTVTLAGGGLSGVMSITAPPLGDIEGQLYHFHATLDTPAVDYYGKGISAVLGGRIYVSGASSSLLYYGTLLNEVTMPAGGNPAAYSHSTFATVTDNPNFLSSNADLSVQSFGSTHIKTWSGGSAVDTPNGSGFVGFEVEVTSLHVSGGGGPGQGTALDFWLTLSNTPVSAIPSAVPEPESWALMLAGLGALGWLGRRRG